ncbi:MAG: M81 family metallopeptidase, partial [Bacillota bacterium]|nr:M81 family metallopeptidase [Bacillota bacterium]
MRTFRVGIGGLATETHTFLNDPTTVEDFEDHGTLWGQEVIHNNRGIMREYVDGYVEVLRGAGAETVGTMVAFAGVHGWVTAEAFDKYADGMAERFRREAGKLDGVLLALHGAMAVTGHPRPEAEIVRRVRAAVGDDISIMVTLDLHANEDHELIDAADAVFVCKQYPHTDMKETGVVAARCLLATLSGEYKPRTAIHKPGIITPSVFQWTQASPAREFRARADEWERREPGIVYISIAYGFGYADVPDVGASVIVVTKDDKVLAETVARDISAYMWERREELARKAVPKAAEAATKALELVGQGVRPVVIGDGSDRTGDSTHVMRELLRRGARNAVLSTMNDARAVKACEAAGIGATISLKLGGWGQASGDPLEVTGTVQWLGVGDYILTGPMGRGSKALCGPSAVVDIGNGNKIVVTSYNHQVLDEQGIVAFGLDFDASDIMVFRSRVHFHAYYDAVPGAVTLEVDA